MSRANIATYRIAGLAAFSLLLFGCGGGGGGSAPAPPPPLGADASLASLSITGMTLVPAFSTAVTSYTVAVPNGTDSVDVAATLSDSSASFTINGSNNGTIALIVGDNTISIVVTAENGTTTRTYTIVVTRAALNNDASLASLSLSVGMLTPVFDSVVTNYTAAVPFGTGSVDVAAATTDVNASFTINGGNNISVGLEIGDNAIVIVVTAEDGTTTRTYAIVVTRRNLAQEAYIKASSRDQNDFFGVAVDLSFDGNTLAVGAWGDDSAATGVNGDETNNSVVDSGAIHVFTRDTGGAWTQQAYVKASNTGENDHFGVAVAFSDDGNTLAVGAYGEASAATGVNSDQADNNAPSAGAVYVFTRATGGVWTQQAYVKASNTVSVDQFGNTVALSANGDTLAVGAFGEDDGGASAGAVYVFTRDTGGVWTQQAYVKASNAEAWDIFGGTVALSADGDTLVVGAHDEASAATGVNGDQADNNAPSAGAIYVFTRDTGGVWTQQAYVKASNTDALDEFGGFGIGISGLPGLGVSLSSDGNTLVSGADGEDSAATGVNGDQTDNSRGGAGAVYVYTRDTGGVWTQKAYVKASNTAAGDRFGFSTALSGNAGTLAVGAFTQNDTVADGGAAYVFR